MFAGAWGVLLVVLLLYGLPLLAGFHLAVDDSLTEFWPIRSHFFQELRAGRFATWCPHLYGGIPLLTMPNLAPFYLVDWPLHLLFPAHRAMDLSFLLHAAMLGLGVHVLLGLHGCSARGAWIGAVVAVGNGWVWRSAMAVSKLDALAWAPWIVVLAFLHHRGRRWAAPAMAAALTLFIASGHLQIVLYLACWVLLLTAYDLVEASRKGGALGPRVFGTLMAWGLALVLSAPSWSPVMRVWRESPRRSMSDFEASFTGKQGAAELLELVRPELLSRRVPPDARLPFVGGIAILLALAALGGRRAPWSRLLWALALLALFLSYGEVFPFYEALRRLPGQAGLRYPHRFDALLALSLSLLAGLGFDRLFGGDARDGLPTSGRRILAGALCALGLFGDLFVRQRCDGEVSSPRAFELSPELRDLLSVAKGRMLPLDRDSRCTLGARERTCSWVLAPPVRIPAREYGLSDNLPAAWGLDSLWGSTQLVSARTSRFHHLDRRVPSTTARDVPDALLRGRLALRSAACSIVASTRRDRLPTAASSIGRVGRMRFFRFSDAVPWSRVVSRLVTVARPEELWRALRRPGGLPEVEALVLRDDLPRSLRGGTLAADGPWMRKGLMPRSREGGRIVLDGPGSDGFLVLAESWDEGWSARVDGVRRALFPVDGRSMAMRLFVGDRRIHLRHREPSLGLALPASGAAGMLLAFWVFAAARAGSRRLRGGRGFEGGRR